MDLIWVILAVVLVRAEAENMTEFQVELGQDVTLICSVEKKDIYWYIEIHSRVKGPIVRTYNASPNDTLYHVLTALTNKYKAVGNTLVITNITEEDYRLYFCGRKQNDKINFTDTFRLVSGKNHLLTNLC